MSNTDKLKEAKARILRVASEGKVPEEVTNADLAFIEAQESGCIPYIDKWAVCISCEDENPIFKYNNISYIQLID